MAGETNFGAASDEDEENQPGGGGKLRAQLEQTISTNKELTREVNTFKAEKYLAEKGLTLVKPEDLADVDPSKWDEQAAKVQEDKQALETEILRGVLQRQGLEGDELDEALAQMVSGPPTKDEEEAEQFRGVRDLGSLAGSPVQRVDHSKLHGFDALEAGLAQQANKQAKRRRA